MSTVETASTEAIRYQGPSPLFKDLTSAFETKIQVVRQSQQDGITQRQSIDMSNIDEIIRRHTGLAITVVVENHDNYYMGISLPPIDLKNPLLLGIHPEMREGQAGFFFQRKAIHKAKLTAKSHRAMIDLENSRVEGAFENFPADLMFPILFLDGKMSGAEVAAIVIHEVGHVFTYLENLLATTSTNLTLLSAWYDYSDTQDPKQQIIIIDELLNELDIKKLSSDNVSLIKTKEEFITVFATARIQEIRSALGSNAYDTRNNEVAADQFAVRHGAGVPLLTGVDKLERQYHVENYMENSTFLMTNVGILGFTAVCLMLSPWLGWAAITTLFVIYLSAPERLDQKRYDDPAERIDRAIHDLIQVSKKMKPNSKQAFKVSDDIQALSTMRSIVQDNKNLFFLIWSNLTARRRDQNAQKVFQRQLEELVNNRLYAQSILLNKLAKQ